MKDRKKKAWCIIIDARRTRFSKTMSISREPRVFIKTVIIENCTKKLVVYITGPKKSFYFLILRGLLDFLYRSPNIFFTCIFFQFVNVFLIIHIVP